LSTCCSAIKIEHRFTGNPLKSSERNRLIMRLDMAARSDELKAKLAAAAPIGTS